MSEVSSPVKSDESTEPRVRLRKIYDGVVEWTFRPPTKAQQQLLLYMGFYMSVFMGAAHLLSMTVLDGLDAHLPESLRLSRVALLGALFVLQLPQLFESLRSRVSQAKDVPKKVGNVRPTFDGVMWGILTHFPTMFVLLLTYGRVWQWPDVGEFSRPWAIFGGAIGAVVLMNVRSFAYSSDELSWNSMSHQDWMYFANVTKQNYSRRFMTRNLSALNTAFLSPAFEDIVYRGFFVFFLGNLVGNAWWGIWMGLILCLALHAYQGPKWTVSILIFYATSVILLYSCGLFAVIACHVFCNVDYLFKSPTAVARYIQYLQQRRMERKLR